MAELVSDCPGRVYPVGRLDMDSEGLLLLTSDGGFAQRVAHPSHEMEKEYLVTVAGSLENCAARLSAITALEDGSPIAPAKVSVAENRGIFAWMVCSTSFFMDASPGAVLDEQSGASRYKASEQALPLPGGQMPPLPHRQASQQQRAFPHTNQMWWPPCSRWIWRKSASLSRR